MTTRARRPRYRRRPGAGVASTGYLAPKGQVVAQLGPNTGTVAPICSGIFPKMQCRHGHEAPHLIGRWIHSVWCGGLYPRIIVARSKSGTKLAVDPTVANTAGWWTPVNAISRRRLAFTGVYRPAKIGHRGRWRIHETTPFPAPVRAKMNAAPSMHGFSPLLTDGQGRS
jgi:hypothetical protein